MIRVEEMDEIVELKDFVDKLQGTSSRKEKEDILRSASDYQKQVLEFLYNPYKITGISKKKIKNFDKPVSPGENMSLLFLLEYLTTHNTGTLVDVGYALDVAYSTPYPELVLSIVRKDLTLGVNATTLNKVYGKGFLPAFKVQLAEKYFDNPDKFVPDAVEFVLTEKFDGVRCVLMFEENSHTPVFYARSGKKIEGLVDLGLDARWLDTRYVYDGELLIDKEGASNNLYRDTMSIVGSDRIKKGIRFHVFDCSLYKEFKEGKDSTPYIERRQRLKGSGIKKTSFMEIVPVLYQGTDKNQIMSYLDWAKKNRKEGVMINIASAPYICDRNVGLLKVKTFNECEAVVRSIEEGTGKNTGTLGAVIVEIKDKTGRMHEVRVGSGFTDKQRNYYYTHPKALIGKVVEISYFEITNNQSDDSLSLRFPTWLDRVRDDKKEEDMNTI